MGHWNPLERATAIVGESLRKISQSLQIGSLNPLEWIRVHVRRYVCVCVFVAHMDSCVMNPPLNPRVYLPMDTNPLWVQVWVGVYPPLWTPAHCGFRSGLVSIGGCRHQPTQWVQIWVQILRTIFIKKKIFFLRKI